jgi:hypothetical protein
MFSRGEPGISYYNTADQRVPGEHPLQLSSLCVMQNLGLPSLAVALPL